MGMTAETLHDNECNRTVEEETPVERRVRIRFELQQQMRTASEQLNDAQQTFNAIILDIIATNEQLDANEIDVDAWMRLQLFKSECQKELEAMKIILTEKNQAYHRLVTELLYQQENMHAPMGVCKQVYSFLPIEKPQEERTLTLVPQTSFTDEQEIVELPVSEAA